MIDALIAYLAAVARTPDHRAAVVAAAKAVADRPWDVVHHAGLLARCRLETADRDLGLTADLRVTRPSGGRGILRLEQGQPYPALDHPGRRSRGAFDTPVDMARRVVAGALRAAVGPVRIGLDPACGTGAFLLAMHEAGVPEVYGTDLDALALEVAQIAVPSARVVVEDALKHGPEVDLVAGNPPFVPPERQDKALRAELRRRFPWLRGRFDLVVPFAAGAVARVRPGGAAGLVLPSAALVQNYGAVLRRRWVERHRIAELSSGEPFPGASVTVTLIVLQAGGGPAPLPAHRITAEELLRLENVPLDPELMPGDVDIVDQIARVSVPLGSVALVDTGLVAHGPHGGKKRLIFDEPGEGRVPYADARDFFAGRRSWLQYAPALMHRAKSPSLFAPPKIVVQRLRGHAPVRAAIDLGGVYVGHTCTVVVPRGPAVPLDRLLELVTSPLVDGMTRIARGQRLDLYPRDVARFPVPRAWLEGSDAPLATSLGLTAAQVARLERVAAG